MSRIQNGSVADHDHLSKCLYSIGIGSNDYFDIYFWSNSTKQFNVGQYTGVLIRQYSKQLKALYKCGARKFVLNGLWPMGCVPFARSLSAGGSIKLCSDEMNVAAELFNNRLESLINEIQSNYADAKFVYIDNAGHLQRALAGFGQNEQGCCKVNSLGLCIPGNTVCPYRNLYVFWDSFHPTEAGNRFAADITFKAIAMNPI